MVIRWLSLLLGLVLLKGSFTFSPISLPDEEWDTFRQYLRDPSYRLPTDTLPEHYEVTLTPYFEVVPTGVTPFTFDGEVTIYLSPTVANVSEIVIHCDDLVIQTLTVEYTDTTSNTVVQIGPNEVPQCEAERSFLRILTTEILVLGQEYLVKSTFQGNLQDSMRGFYRSWYYDSTRVNGTKRWMATTQFQPGHARQAFPCYDEPAFKATFDITMVREEDFSPTISNMPIRNTTELANGRVAELFYTTPKTSTYLLAFIVSHYEQITSNNDEERPFHIYARDDVGTTGQWALEIGELLLDAMEEYTNITYYDVAVNMDMKQAAIPDFSAGAMENWGLLTYREALILYDPNNSNHFYRQRVANIVSHEIAHMWFGNLVTCAWWDNLWLNEGFARYYQYYMTGSVAEDLGFEIRFIVEQIHASMFSDSIDSAHPLTDPSVNNPTQVSNHFSTITYARGASVLRMTEHLLGNDTFVKGLRIYLKDRAYDVAEPQHLFRALDEAAVEDTALAAYNGITIEEYFKTWSEKAGHPLLTVTVNQRTGTITITQARWERNTGQSQYPGLWHIPITWTRAGNPDFEDLKPSQIFTGSATIINRGTTGYEWVIFNKQESGFYRVNYDNDNWALITLALRSSERTVIHEFNRAQIVNDLFALARARVLPYTRAFNIISFLEFEDQYAPWLAAIDGFSFVLRRVAHDADNLQKLQDMIINLSTAATARLGYTEITGESYMDGLMRMYLLEFLCDIGHVQCNNTGVEYFQNWKNGGVIPPNMRPWVYCAGLRAGNADDFDYFWDRYLEEDLANEKVVMLQVAGCTGDQASLEKFLDAIVAGDEAIRPQDYSTALSSAVTSNEINTLRAFEWLKSNINQTKTTLGSAVTPVSLISSRLLDEDQIGEFQTWLEEESTALEGAYQTGISGIATSRSNLEWSSNRVEELAAFFEIGYVDDVLQDLDESIEEGDGEEDGEEVEEDSDEDDDDPDSANIAALSFITLLVTVVINFII